MISQKNFAEKRLFSNQNEQFLEDKIIKYDFEEKIVLLEKNGKVPINKFSDKDQAYILQWNQKNGFESTMRFKMEIQRERWSQIKGEQSKTPVFVDIYRLPHLNTLTHNITYLNDYESYTSIDLEAVGFKLKLRNQNFFPIENITVESKIISEKQKYIISDSIFEIKNDLFSDVTTIRKIHSRKESISVIIPLEEINCYSASAILSEHKIDRSNISIDNTETSITGLSDLENHYRKRSDKLIGVWFRVGIQSPNGDFFWRNISVPEKLCKELKWDEI